MMLLEVLLAASAAASAGAIGPTQSEFVQIIREQGGSAADIRAKTIRLTRCTAFEEEPTELFCDFRAQTNAGAWRKRRAIITYDKGWLLLDLE